MVCSTFESRVIKNATSNRFLTLCPGIRPFGEDAGDGSITWAVEQAVPLRAIFILEQSANDRLEPIGTGRAVTLLNELSRQASDHLLRNMPRADIGTFNLRRFENLCALAQSLPAYLLHVSLNGTFWKLIERALKAGE